MSFDILYDFFKKINYKRILPLFLCPVLFFCTSFSVFAANNNFSNFYNQVFPYNLTAALYLNGGRVLEDSFDNENRFYEFYNFSTSPVTTISLHNRIIPDGWDITFLFAEYDYYLAFTCIGDAGQIENFTYFPTRLAIQNHSTSHDGSTQTLDCINTVFYHHDTANEFGFTAIGQVPVLPNNFIFSVNTYGSSGTVPKDLRTSITVFQVPKSDGADISQVISAIQSQTSELMNAGSGFGGTSSSILSGNEQLSGFIDDYTQVEQSMYDKFTENQSAVIDNFSGFAWGSLSTAVDWTSDYLNRIYDNSGDFRTMFMYPILAGIALIFIGRQGLTAYVRSRREK